ncbi:MAG: type II toxin-antitoxin system VapC family toxin [Tepidiformaceae bacterium]
MDTDRAVEFLNGRGRGASLLAELSSSGTAISIVTYAELYQGVYYGRDRARQQEGLRKLLSEARVLGINRAVARRAAIIRGLLRAQGMPVPLPDVLIAATALEHEVVLVTGNLRHFERIERLRIL